jgi:hypothetical protein
MVGNLYSNKLVPHSFIGLISYKVVDKGSRVIGKVGRV